jgi:signal peptidase I
LATTLRRLWKNEYFKTAITIALIPLLVGGFWFGLQVSLNTKIFPLFTVTSESMCIPPGECDPFAHTFTRTLHVGDLLVIQGVNPRDLITDYPNSDVIVFHIPGYAENDPRANIVHRIASIEEVNGTLYFHTKGDGNGYPDVWPNDIYQGIDSWSSQNSQDNSTYNGAISQDYVYGKVIMRVPWIGLLALVSQHYSVIPIILILIIIILVVIEFVLPLLKKKTSSQAGQEPANTNPENQNPT